MMNIPKERGKFCCGVHGDLGEAHLVDDGFYCPECLYENLVKKLSSRVQVLEYPLETSDITYNNIRVDGAAYNNRVDGAGATTMRYWTSITAERVLPNEPYYHGTNITTDND